MILVSDKPEMRRHHVQIRAKRNPVLQGLLAEIPEFQDASQTAELAAELAKQAVQAAAGPGDDWPATPADLTEAWLTRQVKQHRGDADAELRIRILRSVEFRAREAAWSHIEHRSEALIASLCVQLRELVEAATEVAGQLSDEVSTAQAAIQVGAADHWKSLTELRSAYDTIREAQRALYRCDTVNFDKMAAGDDSHTVDDLDARLYFHRNLVGVAPDWRGHRTNDAAWTIGTYPWPVDPVEKLLWFIRNDSGIWCPTGAQVDALVAEIRASASAEVSNVRIPVPPAIQRHMNRMRS